MRPRARTCVRAALALLALAGAPACAHRSDYIWVSDVPRGMFVDQTPYAIQIGDVISVRVFNQDANSVDHVRVREDGKIAMPLVGDVDVDGVAPAELAHRLEVKLKAFVNSPYVTVVVNERRPLRVSVLGKVVRPGVYDLGHGAGVLHALAAAGGLTPFADENAIFVIRSGYWADSPAPARIRFTYQDLTRGKAPAALFSLRAGDVVVAE